MTFYLSIPLLTHRQEEDHSWWLRGITELALAEFPPPLFSVIFRNSNGWDKLSGWVVWEIFRWESPRSNSIGYTEFVACEWETVRNLNHLKLHSAAHISQVITSFKEKVCGKEALWMEWIQSSHLLSPIGKILNLTDSWPKNEKRPTLNSFLLRFVEHKKSILSYSANQTMVGPH